ncbi:MAG TPA: hypothetical protein VEC93_06255, partial [Anaerolineae bacterium]|nr:hypothetical protein [Anaerolineae bacterium]
SALPDLNQVQTIRIRDEWNGLSPIAPLGATYDLERAGDHFAGTANFTVGGRGGNSLQATEAVELPPEAVQTFLQTLASAPLTEGAYQPNITHTDDYPAIYIELELGTGTMTFFTQSQGEAHVPWGAEFNGKTYVINSDAPAKALAALEPYLKRDVLDQLKEQALSQN